MHCLTNGFPGGTNGKEPTCQCRRHKRTGSIPGHQGDSLEKGMVTHSSILAPGSPEGNTEGPGTASSEPLLPS